MVALRLLPFDYAAKNLLRRPLRSLLGVLACALVAALLVAAAAFSRALSRGFSGMGREDVAILVSAASERDVMRSAISPAVAEIVAAEVQGVRSSEGVPHVSPEIHLAYDICLGDEPERHAALLRGVTSRAFLVHGAVTLLEGSTPGPGEVVAGRLAATRLGVADERLAVGATIRIEGRAYRVSGRFAAPGTALEGEIWAPLHELMGVARRDDISCVFVGLESPRAFTELEVFSRRRLDLELSSVRSSAYYADLAAYFGPLRRLVVAMCLLIAVAGLLTGASTLHTAVRERAGELATLRALGFGALALARSLLEEAATMAAAGGLLGLVLARLFLHGASVRISMSAVPLAVDGAAISAGFIGVLCLGAAAALPAVARALRLHVAAALRED